LDSLLCHLAPAGVLPTQRLSSDWAAHRLPAIYILGCGPPL